MQSADTPGEPLPSDPTKPSKLPTRAHPVHGVNRSPQGDTIVFLTVCTKDRQRWLADSEVEQALRSVWTEATAWRVGRYVLMPDHLHLLCSPGSPDLPLDNWVKYWKAEFSKAHRNRAHRWQTDHWDRRLRDGESCEEKWAYIRNNPVRHKIVERADDWPFQGEVFRLLE